MNRVVHFEIHSKDLDRTQKFYEDVFGWTITDMGREMGGFRAVVTGKNEDKSQWNGINGGLIPRMGESPKGGEPVNAFICTIEVENIDETLEKIAKAGGTVALEKMEIPGVGWLAYRKDPEGNIFGVLQPAKQN